MALDGPVSRKGGHGDPEPFARFCQQPPSFAMRLPARVLPNRPDGRLNNLERCGITHRFSESHRREVDD